MIKYEKVLIKRVGRIVLVAGFAILISSGCVGQHIHDEARVHYAGWSIINAEELEEFATDHSPEDLKEETTYCITAFRPAPRGQVVYVFRSRITTNEYPGTIVKTYTTELNALDVETGRWLWRSWVNVGGQYWDSAISRDGKTMALISAVTKWEKTGGDLAFQLSMLSLDMEGREIGSIVVAGNGSSLQFSPDGKYIAVLARSASFFLGDVIYIYQLPLSDYNDDAKKPVTIGPFDALQLWYVGDPATPSHLHVFRTNWYKTYHGVFDTKTGKAIESMRLRKDFYNTRDVCVVGDRFLLIHGIKAVATTLNPGAPAEVNMQRPLVDGTHVVSITDRFVVVGEFNYVAKGRPYILSIFDGRNLNKPPVELRILGLRSPNGGSTPPPTAVVGNYLLVFRVPRADWWGGTKPDSRTILRYDLRNISSLWE